MARLKHKSQCAYGIWLSRKNAHCNPCLVVIGLCCFSLRFDVTCCSVRALLSSLEPALQRRAWNTCEWQVHIIMCIVYIRYQVCEWHITFIDSSGVARSQRLGAGKVDGIWGSGDGSPQKLVEKHDINFVLRFTLVNAYRPFYSSYIITFVIRFPRSSHISDFHSSPYLSPTPTMCSHFSSDLRESHDRVQGRGDANDWQCSRQSDAI